MRLLQRFSGEDLPRPTIFDDDANAWTVGPAYALMQAAMASTLAASSMAAQIANTRYDEGALPMAPAASIVADDEAPPRPITFDEQQFTARVRYVDEDPPPLVSPIGAEDGEGWRTRLAPEWPPLVIAAPWSWDDGNQFPMAPAVGIPDEFAWIPPIPTPPPIPLPAWRFDSEEFVPIVAPDDAYWIAPVPWFVPLVGPPPRDEHAGVGLVTPPLVDEDYWLRWRPMSSVFVIPQPWAFDDEWAAVATPTPEPLPPVPRLFLRKHGDARFFRRG